MNQIGPRILLIFNSELEATKIETSLKTFSLNNLHGTDHVMTAVKHCTENNVDIIIANLCVNNELIAERLLSKKALLGIPIIFFTSNLQLYETFNNSKLLKENKHIAVVPDPINNNNLFNLINRLYRLKIAKKTKDYFIAKKYLGQKEKVYYKDITYIESEISHCKLHTKWAIYKITGNLTKLLSELESDFLKIHEKYAVNTKFVNEYSKQYVKIENLKLPIRKVYNQQAKAKFDKNIGQKNLKIGTNPLSKMISVA